MTFSLTVLGCSAAVPAHNRNLSAHLLNANERFFLIDCGEGTQFQLRKFRISQQRIKHILISHLHGDHYFGLIGLLNTMHLLGRSDELHLYAPGPLEEILQIQLDAAQTKLNYPLVFHPLQMERQTLVYEEEHLAVHSFPLRHSVPTCGFVFREQKPPRKVLSPRSYAYCSDTGYDEEVIPNIRDVKLLYHEATFMQDRAVNAAEKLHSTAMEAATIALKANAGKLLIGHFSARYEELDAMLAEARSVFPATFPAEEGIKLNI
jgi:ribonuclease Z